MLNKLLPLAIAGAAPLLALGFGAQAQPDQPLNQAPLTQPLTPSAGVTQTCSFTSGARSGSTIDYSATPGAPSVPVGSRCADLTGSSGLAVAPETARQPGQGRFYRSPGAPAGLDPSGRPRAGFTLTCRFNSGPLAGSTQDFTGTLGATPIRIGAHCSDGTSRGVGVAPGR